MPDPCTRLRLFHNAVKPNPLCYYNISIVKLYLVLNESSLQPVVFNLMIVSTTKIFRLGNCVKLFDVVLEVGV